MATDRTAFAKVNLCLHVVGQRADGYHLLDSIVVFADFGDQISVQPADTFSLTVDGPFGAGLGTGLDNLVLRAADLYRDHTNGAAIRLTKTLPIAAGIGGGSADAAATLQAMSVLTGAPLPADAGLSLGADVPVCLASTACRMQGIGDQITPVLGLPTIPAVLVRPNVEVSTPQIFKAMPNKNNPAIGDIPDDLMSPDALVEFLHSTRNDLQDTAMQQTDLIGTALATLTENGASLARMSGSGATCFGLYPTADAAQQAALAITLDHPDFWVQPVMLNSARDNEI